jgi:hypothetical protein
MSSSNNSEPEGRDHHAQAQHDAKTHHGASDGKRAPDLHNPPARHEQDTQAVEGEHVLNPPDGQEQVQRSTVQG